MKVSVREIRGKSIEEVNKILINKLSSDERAALYNCNKFIIGLDPADTFPQDEVCILDLKILEKVICSVCRSSAKYKIERYSSPFHAPWGGLHA
jgi:hypothetical protein